MAWSAKLLSQKEEGLEEITLRNPTVHCLLAALRCRDMKSLKIEFCPDEKYSCPVLLPSVPVQRQQPLKALITDGGVSDSLTLSPKGVHDACAPPYLS